MKARDINVSVEHDIFISLYHLSTLSLKLHISEVYNFSRKLIDSFSLKIDWWNDFEIHQSIADIYLTYMCINWIDMTSNIVRPSDRKSNDLKFELEKKDKFLWQTMAA